MQLPKITVVTASYNQARFIGETLESVWRSGYPNLEHIVVDGGSSDGSVCIIRSYADRLSWWVSEPDGGHTQGLIKGFSRATGDILCWLNSDDLFEPWTLREVGHFFLAHPEVRAAYGDATWIDPEGRRVRPKKEHSFNRFIWTYAHNFIPQPSTFWRRDLYLEVGGLNPDFELAMDADLWSRFADVTPLVHVPRLWSRMRLYPQQRNQRFRARSNHEDLMVRRRWIGAEGRLSCRAKYFLAKGMRVGWKLCTQCYW
ncbi:MAG: glycosyltransferase [Acidobacteria bacterium]|nr:glycosyltransferase [Acidobacteriota bacterium]